MQDPFESGLDQLEDADNQINNDSSKDYTEPPESLEEVSYYGGVIKEGWISKVNSTYSSHV